MRRDDLRRRRAALHPPLQRAHLIDKMGARSLADLVRMADRLGVAPTAGVPPAAWEADAGHAATGAGAP